MVGPRSDGRTAGEELAREGGVRGAGGEPTEVGDPRVASRGQRACEASVRPQSKREDW